MKQLKHILWVDDEVDLLKPHIIFLEEKGYKVSTVYSGEDAIELCKKKNIDLVLMDEMMNGLDGLSTLKIIKEINIAIPIIMVTKNEEEWLMDEAIGEKISNYLIKPVSPSQVFIACKKILDNEKIGTEKNIKEFLVFYNNLQTESINAYDFEQWVQLNTELCRWSIKLDEINDNTFKDMFYEQVEKINKIFQEYYLTNYKTWINSKNNKPILSNNIFNNNFLPIINSNKNLIIVIIDCFKMDQWIKISHLFHSNFTISEDSHFAIIPSATPFARNAIFSGLMPSEIKDNYSTIWHKMFKEGRMNGYEDELFISELKKRNINKSFKYVKISNYEEGQKFYNKINDYKNINILSIVVNFVDILGHSRSESDILKELIPNESAYRNAIYNWFENSWLYDCFKEFANWNSEIILTSDHGNVKVNKPATVKADNMASKGVRYKYGRNLNVDKKRAFKIKNPKDYKLPTFDVNTEYIIAKDSNYFIYSNQYHKYVNMYKKSFQHGGISMDEIIVPLIKLKVKNG